MKATEALTNTLGGTQFIFMTYLSDLSDADLLVRPVPEANHAAWQLGHLISAEVQLGSPIPGVSYPPLPPGFAEQHSKETASQADGKGFLTKAAYLDLLGRVRGATVAAVAAMSDADLDKPNAGRMAQFAPTIGALVVLIANHTLMHGGQVAVLRRKLGKPILL
jgi:hypothetical protein